MEDEEFEKRLNKEKSFINTSKNHTAEFEKQLEEHKEEHITRDELEKRKQDIRDRLFTDDLDGILKSSDSSSGIGGLVASFVSILVALVVGVGVAIPVIQETLNETNMSRTMGTIVSMLPLMVGLVLFVAVASLIAIGRD